MVNPSLRRDKPGGGEPIEESAVVVVNPSLRRDEPGGGVAVTLNRSRLRSVIAWSRRKKSSEEGTRENKNGKDEGVPSVAHFGNDKLSENTMKTTSILVGLILGVAAQCFGAGDPVSITKKDERQETTTFQRDGKTILKVILYRPAEPERRLLRQAVIFNDQVVLEIAEFRGKRVFDIRPNAHHISVGIQASSTGPLENVVLMDDAHHIIELFEVKDSQLKPISGKGLERNRAIATDLMELFSPDNVKKTTPKAFVDRAMEMVEKYKKDESGKPEKGDDGDKPTPRPPSK